MTFTPTYHYGTAATESKDVFLMSVLSCDLILSWEVLHGIKDVDTAW